jgi:hypothetical protein
MNAFLRISFLFSIFSVAVSHATEATVQVAGSRELRLAIVDGSKATTSRDLSHSAFAASLGQAVSAQDGSEIGVKVKCVNADQAAFNLSNGIYDAVLVLTGSLPRALMTSDVTRLNATLGDGKTEKKVYLIFNNGDQTLAKILASSFPAAMTDTKFLDALDGVGRRIATADTGSKLAATP